MHKRYELEQSRIDADNATITFTIALRGPHAWEMQMEDSHRYHSISQGWATEIHTIGKYHLARAASVLRQRINA